MRKTIYIPADFDWDGLKAKAKDTNLSVSQYLLSGHSQGHHKPNLEIDELHGHLARIEGKIDELLSIKPIVIPEVSTEEIREKLDEMSEPVNSEEQTQAEGQAELDAERKKRSIKKDKIKKVKSTGFFSPNPKDGK